MQSDPIDVFARELGSNVTLSALMSGERRSLSGRNGRGGKGGSKGNGADRPVKGTSKERPTSEGADLTEDAVVRVSEIAVSFRPITLIAVDLHGPLGGGGAWGGPPVEAQVLDRRSDGALHHTSGIRRQVG